MTTTESHHNLARLTLDHYQSHIHAGFDPEAARFLSLGLVDAEIEDSGGYIEADPENG